MEKKIAYLEHINELEKILSGARKDLDKVGNAQKEKLKYTIDGMTVFSYSTELEFGQIPVFLGNPLRDIYKLELNVSYNAPKDTKIDSIKPFDMYMQLLAFDLKNNSLNNKSYMKLLKNDKIVGDFKDVFKKYSYSPDTTPRNKEIIARTNLMSIFPTCIEFDPKDNERWKTDAHNWPVDKKLEYIANAMSIFFKEKGFEPSQVDLTAEIDNKYQQWHKEGNDSMKKYKRKMNKFKDTKKIDLSEKQIIQLKKYLPKFFNLDEEVSSLIDSQRQPVIFDPILTYFDLPKIDSISDVNSFTKKMNEFANSDDPGKVFRRMESIFGYLGSSCKDIADLSGFLSQRKEYYNKLAFSYGH